MNSPRLNSIPINSWFIIFLESRFKIGIRVMRWGKVNMLEVDLNIDKGTVLEVPSKT